MKTTNVKTRLSRAFAAGLAALLLGAAPHSIAAAQTGFFPEQPSAALGRHLRTLVANPRNLDALRGAGRAALEVGDLDAAVGFFARAEEVAPRDGRTKAGLGSVFTMLRQPAAALRYFQDAVAFGVPVLDIARDRGLAYDLRGNTRLAQADYKLVLASRPDPEVTRRLALSQAIAGDQKAALATLQPLIGAREPAAIRVRAFVLAITGDPAGATKAAQAVMPAAQANGFAPYFRRMAGLRKSEKAAAAHFGSFPGDPGTIRMADLMSEGERAARVALENAARTPVLAPSAGTDAGRPDAGQVALGRGGEAQVPASTAGSRVALTVRPAPSAVTPRNPAATTAARPGFSGDLIRIVGSRVDAPAAAPIAAASRVAAATPAPVPSLNVTPAPTPAPVVPTPSPSPVVATPAPPVTAAPTPAPTPAPAATAPTPAPASALPVATTSSAPVQGPPVPFDLRTAPGSTPLPSSQAPAVATTTPTPGFSPPPAPRPKVEPVATAAASAGTLAPPPARPKVEVAASAPAPSRPKVEASARPATTAPARHYAQVGIGQDVKALAGDWRRLRAQAGPVLAGARAWTAKLNRTNRLLVGPFDSAREAQAFVNKLTAAKVSAYVFSSGATDEVVPIGR